jgi:hypothetical protein
MAMNINGLTHGGSSTCGFLRRLSLVLMAAAVFARQAAAEGIPEPPLTLYGTVFNTFAGSNTFWTVGSLTWTFQNATGRVVTVTTPLTNIGNQFSYVVQVPCETPLPGFQNSSNTLLLIAGNARTNARTARLDGVSSVVLGPASPTLVMTPTNRAMVERVDLQVSTWEQFFFGSTGINPNADPDGDGMSNLQEFLAGTNPTDAESSLRIVQVLGSNTNVRVDWSSADGRIYALERAPALQPSSNFTSIAINLTSTPPVNAFIDTNASSPGPHFYRIRVQR